MKSYKKSLVLIPSAYNSKVMGDVENFIKYYKDDFSVYVIYDNENKEEDGVTYINRKNPKAEYLKLTADYIIDAGSINYKTRVMDSQKRVSVWHGIPYKKMFIDLDKVYVTDALEYDEGIDLMVSPCKFYTEEFLRKSMLYRGEILETAVSRTDSLYKSNEEKDEIKDLLSIPKDKKILLYAPTFRVKGPFKLPFDPKKVLKKLNKNADEWVIVTKLHYLSTLETNDGNIIDCTNHSCVNDLLAICDLMITDYSSLFFDYSIMKKPAIFYQYDQKDYLSDRGFMFDLEDYVDKKYIVTNEADLLNILGDIEDVDNLKKVQKTFYPHQKKDSTAELVKKLNFDNKERHTKDIIFLVNELNEIGGIHNFLMNLTKEFKAKYNSRVFVIATKTYSTSNKDFYEFDKDGILDLKLAADRDIDNIRTLLKNTDGYIISCQFGAHRYFEPYLKDKNVFLMFHGDTKDVISKNIYKWHLNALNNFGMYNYKKFLLLTKGNMDLISTKLNNKVKARLGYMENSYNYKNRKNYFKENGEFAFVSRLDYDKNVFDIIKIFSDKKLDKNFKVHIYGDGKLRTEFEDKVKELKLEKRIIVHGYCDNKDEIYKDKQGIILTSLTEGFSLTILEAVNYGIPVYLYNSFTATIEFKDYNVIRLIETSNIDKFVEALNKGVKFKPSDFDEIVDRFSNDTIVQRWIEEFDEIEKLDSLKNVRVKNILKNIAKDTIYVAKRKAKKFLKKHCYKFALNNRKVPYDMILNYNYAKYKVKHLFKNKKGPLVSIVVPYYNSINTIEALLKSIQKSGYKNYEVLVINDGCDEDPSKICSKYRRVKYFKKKNEGPGLTRNYGIERAKGKYIFFIDSDDELCKGALNYLVDYAEKNNLDVVGGRARKYPFKKRKLTFWFKKLFRKTYINTMANRIDILSDTMCTAKVYNLENLKKSGIRFESGLYEDLLFMARIYSTFDRVGLVNRDIYNWINYGEDTSITTTFTLNQMTDRIDKMEKIYDLAMDKNKSYYVTHAISHDLYIFVKSYLSFNEKDRKKVFDMFRKYFIDKQDHVYFKDVILPHKREAYRCMIDNDFEKFNTIALCFSYKDAKDNGLEIEE